MKSSRVMKIFEQYVKKFDMNNTNIKSKYFQHIYTIYNTNIGIVFDTSRSLQNLEPIL